MARKGSSAGAWLVAGVVLAGLVAVGIFAWRHGLNPEVAPGPASSTTAPSAPAAAASPGVVQHPIADAGPAPATTTPLPALGASDTQVADALAGLAGNSKLRALLLPDQIIPRIVATVDALPRRTVGARVLPLHTPTGSFRTGQAGGNTVISADNAARYAPYMQVVENVDPKALVAWYVESYPLFQQAYQDLGYPKGYFNDRLIVAIDDMLAAPSPDGPIVLVRPKVFYRYADPELESLSAGQKLMIRVGPANEAKIKARLRAVRAALTGARLPPATASTATPTP
jgi:hypothetical protein